MKKFKSLLALLLAVILLCSVFAGCTKNGKDSEEEKVYTLEEASVPAEEHESANGILTTDNGKMVKDLTSVELVRLMGNGTNLGNTMEATDSNIKNHSAYPISAMETMWGQPETTQEMISYLKKCGFDTIRIPVAWINNGTTYAEGNDPENYIIREDLLDRVETIINYALNEDMYVIINDHWDAGWWAMFGQETDPNHQKAIDIYVSMWTQLSERYKEYGYRLIFEGGNEEIGSRFNDADATLAPEGATLNTDEYYELANKVNQLFVDTVRATGGNNEQRFLLIPGINTNIANTCDERFVMPTDTAENKLLVSVHFYDPWTYCGDGATGTWGIKSDYEAINETLNMMDKFTEAGYGVIIGECGVLNTDGCKELLPNALEYHANLLANCDLHNYCPVLWDCSGFFNRNTLSCVDSEFATLYRKNSNSWREEMTEEEIKEAAEKTMAELIEAAPEKFREDAIQVDADTSVAWIMWNSSDWTISYSVGDTYAPDSLTTGLSPTDVLITGEGTYTVSLDFTGVSGGFSNSTAFSALAIANGEILFPGYYIEITEVKINGEVYENFGKYYTTSDDQKCTRVNLYNQWVSEIPAEARRADGDLSGATPMPLDNTDAVLKNIKTLEITFEYVAPAE